MADENPIQELSSGSDNSSLYGQTNPFANNFSSYPSATSSPPTASLSPPSSLTSPSSSPFLSTSSQLPPYSSSYSSPSPAPTSASSSLNSTSVDDILRRNTPAIASVGSANSNTQSQIAQSQQKQIQQLNLYRASQQMAGQQQQQQQQQQQHLQQQIHSQIQQQQMGQQQQQLQQFMTKMMENFDRMNKYLSDVDQRIAGLEKATREVMVNQKAQKENMQQHYMQILQKINELRTTMPLGGSIPTAVPSAIPIPTGPLAMPSYSLPVAPAPSRPSAREQEDLDAELARKLQAEFNVEATRTSSSSTTRTEPSEECPLCQERVPKSQIEQHVNKHLDEEPSSRSSDQNASDGGGLWSRLFGKSEAEKKKAEEEAKKKAEEEAKKKAEEEAKKKQQQQQQATPVLTTLPQGYYLAPSFLPPQQPAMGGVPVVYRGGLYPGQPMMYPDYPSNTLQ